MTFAKVHPGFGKFARNGSLVQFALTLAIDRIAGLPASPGFAEMPG